MDYTIPELCDLKWGSGDLSWSELETKVGKPRSSFRSAMRRYKRDHPNSFRTGTDEPKLIASQGVQPGDRMPDEDEAYKRAVREWRRTRKLMEAREDQFLVFDHGPIALVNTADWHLGGSGVDYPRLNHDLNLIADTPGMYAVANGDLLNQMIVGRLLNARLNESLTIRDEWALVRRMLKIVAPKTVALVMGNHDNWLEALTGISYFERELRSLKPDLIFDTDDAKFTVKVADWSVPVRVRHQWKGRSIYNPTHGIERAAKWDQDFVIGMGAHTHESGVTRSFNMPALRGWR